MSTKGKSDNQVQIIKESQTLDKKHKEILKNFQNEKENLEYIDCQLQKIEDDITNLDKIRNKFTLEQLKTARNTKLNDLASSSMSNSEKQAYAEQVIRLYKKAKKELASQQIQSNQPIQSELSPFTSHNLFSNNFSDINGFINSSNIFNRMMNHMQRFEQSLNMNSSFNNNLTNLNNANTQSHQRTHSMSQSKSYSERTVPDGTKIVIEVTKTNNNGQVNQVVKTHKVMPDGTLQQIDYNDAIQQITNSTESN